MATMKKARVLHRKALKPEDADILEYFMWSMMTKLKHVQQAAADLTIPTE